MPSYPYNIAGNQQLGASSLSKGRALMAGARRNDAAASYLEQQSDTYAEDRAFERGLLNREAELKAAQEKRLGEAGERDKLRFANEQEDRELGTSQLFAIQSTRAYDEHLQQNPGDEKGARAAAQGQVLATLDAMTLGGRDEAQRIAQERGVDLSPENYDYETAKRFVPTKEQDVAKYAAKDTYIDDDGKEKILLVYDSPAGPIKEKTGILAANQGGGDKPYSPPSGGDREAALNVVAKDDLLSDLPDKDKQLAAEMIAQEVRQIMTDSNGAIKYEEATQVALERVKKKVRYEPGAIYGKNPTLDIPAGELGDDEYVGTDGTVYVRIGPGKWRVK